jgi:hypothetical protein
MRKADYGNTKNFWSLSVIIYYIIINKFNSCIVTINEW